ncbi:TolC family protein, partial [Roseateles sp. GG27B]
LLRSATVADNAARERYSAGVGSLLELLLAQSSAAQARVSLVQARYDARLAVAQLGYAVGYALQSAPSNLFQPMP